ncbi:MAG: hypothetical protein LBK67_12055 [Coriobacteriales bacterium]|jgi:hypothetical protein|nr:hypothetical protein [Coriobacteriales bacterium]
MRMSAWTPQILYFLENASYNSTYFRGLAAIVKEHTTPKDYLCDAGSGMSQLSVELSPYVRRIDATDCSMNAVSYTSGRLAFLGIRNIAPIHANLLNYQPDERYDLMVFSLSLSVEDAYSAAQGRCRGHFLVINKVHRLMEEDRRKTDCRIAGSGGNNGDTRQLFLKQRPLVYDFQTHLDKLHAAGKNCTGKQISLRFDQPFKNLDEAHLFFRLFRNKSYPNGLSDGQLLKLLIETEDSPYPLRLPITRHLAIFSCFL